MALRILFGGISSAGKSTLACSVYQWMRVQGVDVGLYELDVWSDTHDCILGCKPWSERDNRSGPAGNYLHHEFAERVTRFRGASNDLVLGDLPGRRNPSWETVSGSADGGIIVERGPLPKDREDFFARHQVDWESQLADWRVPVIVRVYSLGHGEPPPPRRICLGQLDRRPVPHHPQVRNIGERLLKMF